MAKVKVAGLSLRKVVASEVQIKDYLSTNTPTNNEKIK